MLAPIALFVYNRPQHTKRVIESLKKNDLAPHSDLIIFSDAPKNAEARSAVSDVRKYIANIEGFKSLRIVEREQNFGLAKSIIHGVTEVVEQFGKIIVLEDDLVCSPFFLKFMNEGLAKYQDVDDVISIHGYVYPVAKKLPETFFLKGADCWGWATWKRGWKLFETDGKKLLYILEQNELFKEFDFDFSYPYVRMLEDQIKGRNDSWAILWYASAFINNKLTLYPGKSLIHNIGLDRSGTHCSGDKAYETNISLLPLKIEDISFEENIEARKIIIDFFKRNKKVKIKQIMEKITSLCQKLSLR